MKMDGFRVLDLSQFLPGPMLTQMLADHGAEVVKIEPPAGEPVRKVGYRSGGESVWFRNTHRGKKSVMLDLKQPDAVEAFLRLAETADVVVEAFRPGVVDRLGVGYAAVSGRNPRIVYASISAFGQIGPESRRPAHDIGIEALAGAISLNLGQDGQPTNPNVPVADMAGSFTALAGILMALLRREKTGRGDYLDVSMQDAIMAWLPNLVGSIFAEDRAPVVRDERSWGGYAFYRPYETADGRHIVLAGVEHKFIEALLAALGREDLRDSAFSPPGPTQQPVRDFLTATFLQRTRDEWVVWFGDKDVCFAPVLDLKEAFDQPHVAHRGMVLLDAEGEKHLGAPIKFRDEPANPDLRLPALGEHTAALTGRS